MPNARAFGIIPVKDGIGTVQGAGDGAGIAGLERWLQRWTKRSLIELSLFCGETGLICTISYEQKIQTSEELRMLSLSQAI